MLLAPLASVFLMAGISLRRERATAALISSNNSWNQRAIDSAIALLQPGDVVLRSGLGADSRIFAELNTKDKSYTHCGIVLMEGGRPMVYHCIGGEENPDQRMRREDAKTFFSAESNSSMAIVRYAGSPSLRRLQQVVYDFYLARPKFDLKFDLASDDALYCSEFVYKSFLRAGADYIPTSGRLGRTYVAIDDLFMNSHARFVCRLTYK